MKYHRLPFTIAIIVSVLIFCATGWAAGSKKYQGVTVKVVSQASQWADAFKKFAPEFTKETGIKVEFEDISFGVMYEKLKTGFIGGKAKYDMIWYDTMWTPEFAKRGWIQDLTPYVKNPELTPADFNYPEDFFGTFYSGAYPANNIWNLPEGIFGIPWIAGFRPLYYRTDLLKAAGLVDDKGEAKPPETLDDLLAYAKKLNDPSNKVYGYVMPAKRPRIVYDWAGFLWTSGGDFFDKSFKPIFNNPEGVKSLELYIALGKLAPPGVAAYHITEAWTAFMQGQAALTWTWQDLASVALKESNIIGKFKCARPPSHNGQSIPLVGGITASFSAKAPNPEAAFMFLTYCQSPERAKQATLLGATVQRRSTWNDPDVEKMYPSAEADLEEYCQDSGRTVPLIPEWATIDQIIGEEISSAFSGQKSAKEALDAAAQKVDKFMKKAGYYK